MKAKKSLGQHFLVQESIAQRIADAIVPLEHVSKILEVGPGRGILTKFLLRRAEHLTVIEVDRDLIPGLRKSFADLTIYDGDFLKFSLSSHFTTPFHLVGNFPYNISSQILFKMLDHKALIPEMVGMFQKEVAQRIASEHGTKRYGILSVLVQANYEVDYLFTVKPGAFAPMPKVDSAVIRLRKKTTPIVPAEQERSFRRLVKLAFGQRRKMLRNSLKSYADLSADPVGQLRPEQLSITDFATLHAKLISSRTDKANKQ